MEHLDTVTHLDSARPFRLTVVGDKVLVDGKELPRGANGDYNISLSMPRTAGPKNANLAGAFSVCAFITAVAMFAVATIVPVFVKGADGHSFMFMAIFFALAAIYYRLK